MALKKFWNSVCTGVSFLAPRASVDSPKINAEDIERGLRGSTIWLTPRAVAGFNEADFDFLPGTERAKLAQLVSEFRNVASKVPPAAPATTDQIEKAWPVFRDIIELLGLNRYGDAEAYRIGKQVERAIDSYLPEFADLWFETGMDSTGDPAIWIWGILPVEDEDAFLEHAGKLRSILENASQEVAPDLFPYISFRSANEQAELVGADDR